MLTPLALDDGAALFPHELGDVVGTAPALSGRAGALPAAERLRAGPGSRGGAGALVRIAHAGLYLVEEPADLRRVGGEDPGGQSVLYPIGLPYRLADIGHLADGDEWDEQLFSIKGALQRYPGNGGRNVVTPIEDTPAKPLASQDHRAFPPSLGNRSLEALHRARIDHRPEEDVAFRGVAHSDGPGLPDQQVHKRFGDRALDIHPGGS